jgi:4-amino-4-deoxy-L-arabinose transferase-like glycosyltransferase
MRVATGTALSPVAPRSIWAKAWLLDDAGKGSGLGLVVLVLGFAVIWLVQLSATSLSPPVDNIEQLTWVRSLEWGYYKHPPLPTWMIWLPVQVFGLSPLTLSVLGAACTLSALGLMWQLLRRLRGDKHAAVALLAALCITYYNGRLNYFNHNVVLMLLSAASAALCWQAFVSRQLRWWLALGAVLGLAALAKYQVVVTLLSLLVFMWHQGAWREPVHRKGAMLAAGLASLLFAPHLAWLHAHEFAPFHYAIESSLGAQLAWPERSGLALHWFVDQVFNRALPALLFLGLALGSRLVAASTKPGSAPVLRQAQADPARVLLLSWGLVPLVFMPLLGVFTGAALQLHWGSPFLLFAVPALMEVWPRAMWQRAAWPRVVLAFVFMQALLLTVNHATSSRNARLLGDRHWRHFDSVALADEVSGPARSALGGPIQLISGPADLAGALALRLPELPLVLIDGRHDRSPWVRRDLLSRCGALELSFADAKAGRPAVSAAFPQLAWRIVRPGQGPADCRQAINNVD